MRQCPGQCSACKQASLVLLLTAPAAGLSSLAFSAQLFSAQAQVVPSAGGAGTQVSSSNNVFNISGGAQTERNLFHEFESFSIDSNQTANFLSDSSIFNIVGQVSGLSPSYINGLVQISGGDASLYLINPAGILFGPNGQLSLSGSFTATTADRLGFEESWLNVLASDRDYSNLSGDLSAFDFTAEVPGSVVNRGDLEVEVGQSLTLIGNNVVNEGRLAAPGGEVGLVAVGRDSVHFGVPGSLLSLEMAESDLPVSNAFTPTDLPTLVTGDTSGGATRLVQNPNGSIALVGANRWTIEPEEVAVTGEITTRTESADGGAIALLGRSIDVLAATVDASGKTGGSIRIGRELGEENLPDTDIALLDVGSVVRADGLSGAGGDIAVGSERSAYLYSPLLSAAGKTRGGFVETSAKYLFLDSATVDASGELESGLWLIDPVDIEIVDTVSGLNQIASSAIESGLDSGTDVTIETTLGGANSGDISLLDSISQTGASTGSLTLTGRRFSTNGSTIDLESTGGLTFNLNAVNPEAMTSGDSVESAIAAIGTVNGDRAINLGNGIYNFSNTVGLNTDVEIVGASRDNTVLNVDTAGRLFRVEPDSNITIRDLTFGATPGTEGGGIWNAGTLALENVYAVGNQASNGGAVGSRRDSFLSVTNSIFESNRSTNQGGAIYSVGSSLNISNSLLGANESGGSGGAVYAYGPSVTIEDSVVRDNVAVSDDGGGIRTGDVELTVRRTLIENNLAGDDGGGVAFQGVSKSALFDDVVFRENAARQTGSSVGEAIAFWDNATATILDSVFERNEADSAGGAIHFSEGQIRVERSQFDGNVASRSGGGILARRDTVADILDSTFDSNAASSGGGGGLRVEGGAIAISNSTFTNNSAAGGGGADFVGGSRATISNSTFDSNRASANGGGIHALGNVQLNLDGAIASNNVARGGGGLNSSASSMVQINSSQFVNNRAENGAGLRTDGSTIALEDTLLERNQASISGGGLWAKNSTVDVAASQFVQNVAMDGGGIHLRGSVLNAQNGTLFERNEATVEDGGGLSANQSSVVDLRDAVFEENTADEDGGGLHVEIDSSASIVNTQFNNNVAGDDGGGLYVSGNSRATVAGGRFERNRAGDNGGGAYVSLSSLASFDGIDFVGNTAADRGGGLTINTGSTANVRNATFEENVASSGGGLGAISGGRADVTDSRFNRNEASSDGGGIAALPDAIVNVAGTTFVNNAAVGLGGGLYIEGLTAVAGSRFQNNWAFRGGGLAAARRGELSLTDVLATNNRSDDEGGGLSVENDASAVVIGRLDETGSVVTSSTSFLNNVAGDDGGGIAVEDRATLELSGVNISNNAASDDGGGLAATRFASVKVDNSYFEENTAADNGGGIYRDSGLNVPVEGETLAVTSSRFVRNESKSNGGGIFYGANSSEAVVSDSSVIGNRAADSGGGIYASDNITIENTTISDNTTARSGGGLLLDRTTAEVVSSTFERNVAEQGGGAANFRSDLMIRDSEFNNNRAVVDGGGLRLIGGTTAIESTDFSNNRSTFGGGLELSVDAEVSLVDSELFGNIASVRGGGIQIDDASKLTVASSTLASNQSGGEGGGLANLGTAELVNATFYANAARTNGGAIASVSSDAITTLRNGTVSENESGEAGGGIASGASIRLLNTIVAENRGGTANDVSGSFIDEGNNLIGQSNGSTVFNRSLLVGRVGESINPSLEPLADNGGPTRTQLLRKDSVAINAGASSNLPATDQRGLSRVAGGFVDIGAVELTSDELPDLVPSPPVPSSPVPPSPVSQDPRLPGGFPINEERLGEERLDGERFLDPTLATNGFEWIAIAREDDSDSDNRTISQLEQAFGRSFEDYWDLPLDTSLNFNDVQSILRRAQEEYKVNSAIIYAVFLPEQIGLNTGENAVYVEPISSPDDLLHLALVMPEGELVRYQLPFTREKVTQQVDLLRSIISDPEDTFGYQPSTQQLYQWLLAPLEEDLARQGIQNLMYALDTGLRNAPVTAMRDYNGFSLERYGISLVPNMGLTQADFGPAVKRPTVAMGISQFETAPPLPAVPIELAVLDDVVSVSSTSLNEKTTIDALESVQALEKPGVLHLATHASFDYYSPESSSISMWNRPLSMKEFAELDWLESDLEMLILSACSTAVSSANAELGFVGLAAASSVDATVGSLWEVSDVGTLALMSEFYTQIEQTTLRFEALRQAQLSLLKGETRIVNGDLVTKQGLVELPDEWNLPNEATLEHPFFWSAFTMVGNPW